MHQKLANKYNIIFIMTILCNEIISIKGQKSIYHH